VKGKKVNMFAPEEFELQPYPRKSYLPFIFYPTTMWHNPFGSSFVKTNLDLNTPCGDYVIYISIPFCRVRCSGCPYFVSLLTPKDPRNIEDAYVEALVKDIKKWGTYSRWQKSKLRSIYIGGGTGSILKVSNLEKVLNALTSSFPVDDECEITLEGNSRDYDQEKLDYVAKSKINRISLGVQSFNKDILKIVGSPHAAESSEKIIKEFQKRGLDNIQMDLMYNMPGHNMAIWESDLEKLKDIHIKHFTIYLYRIHEGTPQHKNILEGKVPDIFDRESPLVKGMYREAVQIAKAMGFHMYMFDHFSENGYQSAYNDWGFQNACDTLGIGAGAYSLIDNYRIGTAKAVEEYIETVNAGEHMVTTISEKMEISNHKERYIIFSFQYFKINFLQYEQKFGSNLLDDFEKPLQKLKKKGLIEIYSDCIEMTPMGKDWRLNVLLEFINPTYWGKKEARNQPNWSMNVPMVDILADEREIWLGVES
jgi:oxygen-independent coproporphyrinogen-3 oxidase